MINQELKCINQDDIDKELLNQEMILHHLMSLRLYDLYEKLYNYYMRLYILDHYDVEPSYD